MPKNPNSKSKPVKREEPMNGAMKFFLAGCVAELYLLIVRRFYVNGTLEQVVAWDDYLVVLGWIGVAVLALGAVLSFVWKSDRKKRIIGWSLAGAGAFLGLSSFLVHWNMSVLTLLSVVVPVVMLLGILWSLYDRECALSLTILGITLVALWVCHRVMNSIYLGSAVKAAAVIYMVVLAVLALLIRLKKLGKLLPDSADPLPVYVACGLSVLAMIAALVSTVAAYYATWILAIVVFGLAVYYTVKQL
jgi:hypothetical protein